jgi:diguanylate cyclase (GGDEF)-like protein
VVELPRPLGPPALGWAFPLITSWCAAYACYRTSRMPGINPGAGRFWSRFSLALALFALALISNAIDAGRAPLGYTQELSAPTSGLYVGGILVAIWAVLRLPGMSARARQDPGRFRLDAVIVVLTTALFVWHFTFRQLGTWRVAGGSTLTSFALLLAGSVIILVLVKVALTGPGPIDPAALRILSLAVACGVLQGALSPLVADRDWLTMTEVGYPWTALVVLWSAHRQCRAVREGRTEPVVRKRRFSLIPYLAVGATDGLLLSSRQADLESLVVALVVVALTGVVGLRQVMAMRENERLLRQIDTNLEELHVTKDRLAYQATHDPVTGLANRHLFEQRITAALAGPDPVTLALIDVDDFKLINDRFGHLAGDEVLKRIGERLDTATRAEDTVARLGGDEFAVLLCGTSSDNARQILGRLSDALEVPIRTDGEAMLVGVSIGLAEAWPGATPDELLHRADLAMYAAKGSGKGRTSRYESDLETEATDRAKIASDLRTALMRGEFRLVFQPIVRLPDGALYGAEALVRWAHPDRGEIPPAEFIPIAETSGMITQLGAWILDEACRRAAGWLRSEGDVPWRVTVNISARQVRERGFAELVEDCLTRNGLPPERLILEVTETAVFDNERAVRELNAISALGVLIALDDFGTGHSSLGLLQTVPADILKVDKSFVDNITSDSGNTVIAAAMIQITEGLGQAAIAEGVETAAQADRLYQLGYRYAQGFHFARPMSGDRIADLLRARSLHPEADRAAAAGA